MAPTAPTGEKKLSARAHRQARLDGTIHPLAPSKLFRASASTSDGFLSSKSDKRMIKHSQFLSRVQSSSDKITKGKNRKNRRPGNKITSLRGLEDALPEVEGKIEAGKVRHKSMRSRPGAVKRKEKVLKSEVDRFGLNMAQLAKMPAPAAEKTSQMEGGKVEGETQKAEGGGQQGKWAALRAHIAATTEQNPAFANKS